jgi:hypothetical protein
LNTKFNDLPKIYATQKWENIQVQSRSFLERGPPNAMDTAEVIYEEDNMISRKLKKLVFTGTTEQAISQPSLYLSAV